MFWIWKEWCFISSSGILHANCLLQNLTLTLTSKFSIMFTAANAKIYRELFSGFLMNELFSMQTDLHGSFLHFTLSVQLICEFISSAVQMCCGYLF